MKRENNIISLPAKDNTSPVYSNNTLSVEEVIKRAEHFKDFIHQTMVEGVDYGKVAGYSNPTLLKPGAEKICHYMKLSIHYEVSHRFEDWQGGMFYYEVRVVLTQLDNMQSVAQGIGSANTKEKQYLGQSPFANINTVLKMAKKRALVDAVLNISATSGIFTQDIEDMPSKANTKGGDGTISKRQLQRIHLLAKEQGLKPDVATELMRMRYRVDRSTQLSKVQASSFIQDLLHLNDAFRR